MSTPKTSFDAIAKFVGQYDRILINQMLNGLDFINDVRVIRNASLNGTLLPKMTVAKGIRNLNLDVDTRAGAHRNWSGRKLKVYPGMKLIDINPEEVYNTFLSDMMAPGAVQLPFAQWIWTQEFAKIGSEINDNIYFNEYHGDADLLNTAIGYSVGTYVSFGAELDIYKCVTTATAGQTPTTHPAKWEMVNELVISDGWGTIIANEIDGGGLTNVITTGAINSTDAVEQLEYIVNSMTPAHRKIGGCLNLSPTNYANYLVSERTKYNTTFRPEDGVGKKTIYGNPQWEVCSASYMGSSGRVIATQDTNWVFGTNVTSDMGKISKTIETIHGSRTVAKWNQGCDFADLETLYVSDQE